MHVLVVGLDETRFQQVRRLVEKEGGSASHSSDAEAILKGKTVGAVVFDWSEAFAIVPELARKRGCPTLAMVSDPGKDTRAVIDSGVEDWVATDAADAEVEGRLERAHAADHGAHGGPVDAEPAADAEVERQPARRG